jgi:aflatoxin B1 aldehyde reductase
MKKFITVCEKNGLTSTEASLRWILHHSILGESDGIILGATRVDQLRGNVEAVKKGPLPKAILEGLEEMWDSVKPAMEDQPY